MKWVAPVLRAFYSISVEFEVGRLAGNLLPARACTLCMLLITFNFLLVCVCSWFSCIVLVFALCLMLFMSCFVIVISFPFCNFANAEFPSCFVDFHRNMPCIRLGVLKCCQVLSDFFSASGVEADCHHYRKVFLRCSLGVSTPCLCFCFSLRAFVSLFLVE